MGCCFSCDENKTYPASEPNERTTLLGNPVSNATSRPSYSDDYGTQPTTPYSQKGDEQAALNRILHQTACNVIDVSAMNSHLEQREYLDRARQYTQRMNAARHRFCRKSQRSLLTDLPAPDKLLSADPISISDLKMVSEACEKTLQALQEVKIEHKEDLVVQFGIP